MHSGEECSQDATSGFSLWHDVDVEDDHHKHFSLHAELLHAVVSAAAAQFLSRHSSLHAAVTQRMGLPSSAIGQPAWREFQISVRLPILKTVCLLNEGVLPCINVRKLGTLSQSCLLYAWELRRAMHKAKDDIVKQAFGLINQGRMPRELLQLMANYLFDMQPITAAGLETERLILQSALLPEVYNETFLTIRTLNAQGITIADLVE